VSHKIGAAAGKFRSGPPDDVEPGYGIRHSIVARTVEVGGAAIVDSHLDQGTRIDLRWPA
jgi:hypothetical protein